MKKLLNWLRGIFGQRVGAVLHTYSIHWETPLNGTQIKAVIGTMLDYFPPNCRPSRLTTSSTYTYFDFYATCLSGEELKNIAERAIAGAKVQSVYLDGTQIWP
jgi:hypothetical protein